jgi:twitching motility protein PilT
MDQLTQYLEHLIATSSFELHLEPNANPYVVSANGNTDVANAPLLGSQISMMIFPLIPAEVKQELPNQPAIEFVHPSNMGDFSFVVQKSSAGFNVTIKPILGSTQTAANVDPPAFETLSDEMPAYELSVDNSLPIDLQPLEPEHFSSNEAAAELESYAAFNDLQAGLPEFDVEVEGMSSADAVIVASLQDLEPAPVYDPNAFDDTASSYVDVEEVAASVVTDRRTAERPLDNAGFKSRMEALFYKMHQFGASDLHLSVDMPPMVRKDGKIQKVECNETVLTTEVMKGLLMSIMPERNRDEFSERRDSDFAYEILGLARFRCNIFMDRKGMGGVFRIIPAKMTTADDLGLPSSILGMCELNKGLVVVTGPTGSGKSTTLCAMVNHINMQREDHIITIEDPIEFVHENQKCLVNQREVHNHTSSFKDALRAALREDPDIILVGEMRDLETIAIAIETAETGHLVFGTLHTTTAPSTVDRIIDQFPADRQQQIRVMLSESLKGVVAQTLLPKIGGGRVAALEILIITPAISNLIREGKTFQIASAMQTGKSHGMVLLNDSLFDLVQKGIVEPRDAYLKAVDKTSFETMLTRGGFTI